MSVSQRHQTTGCGSRFNFQLSFAHPLGRLQTERDKARVMDGLEGASAGAFDRAETDRLLSGLATRTFLMSNAHDDAPALFQTRWALSYLCGPLTGEQIARLNQSGKSQASTSPQPKPAPAPRSLRRRRCGGVKWVVGPCCASLCRSDFGGRPTRELLGEGRSR